MELEKVEEIRMGYESNRSFNKATGAGFIIAMGIVYGDIGTSPLYTMESIVQGQGGCRFECTGKKRRRSGLR